MISGICFRAVPRPDKNKDLNNTNPDVDELNSCI